MNRDADHGSETMTQVEAKALAQYITFGYGLRTRTLADQAGSRYAVHVTWPCGCQAVLTRVANWDQVRLLMSGHEVWRWN